MPTTIARVLIFVTAFVFVTHGDEIVLLPSMDATIYEGEDNTANSIGNGLFSGATSAFKNGNLTRRALLAFDIASNIPSDAQITDASLTLTVNKVPGNQQAADFGLFVITSPWIEGATATFGAGGQGAARVGDDTTWTSTGLGDWTTPGGDFMSEPSAVTNVGARGQYSWSSDGMVEDIQSWLNDPESNAGWMLVVDGDPPTTFTAKRFASKENSDAASRPTLTINFEAGPNLLGDYNSDGKLTASDIGFICTAINGGENPGEFDLNNDGVVNLMDLTFWVEDIKGTFLGDQNLDGAVNFADFLVVSSQFGFMEPQPEPNFSGWASGDFNCDAEVSFADFLILSENFGRGEQAAAVPEPTFGVLAFVGVVLLVLRRRRQ